MKVVPAQSRGWIPAALLIVGLTACGPFYDPEVLTPPPTVVAGQLGRGHWISQTFLSQCANLAEVDVQIAIYPTMPPSSGHLDLVLSAASATAGPFTTVARDSVPEAALSANQWLGISFGPMGNSAGHWFDLDARTSDAGLSPVTLWANDHDQNAPGQREENGTSQPGTIVLRTACDETPGAVVGATIQRVTTNGLLWPAELALVLVPGLAFALWFWPAETDFGALLGLGVGWSVLLAPLALALATPWHAGVAAGPLLLVLGFAGVSLWVARRHRRGSWFGLRAGDKAKGGLESYRHSVPPSESASDVAAGEAVVSAPSDGRDSRATGSFHLDLVGVGVLVSFVAAGFTRAALARHLALPMWVDSPQHSYVVALIQQVGGLPTTYGALMPSQVFDYHFGFQALAAFGGWLSPADPGNSVLATGQLLGAAIGPALYLFTRDLTGSRRAGLVAAVLVAVVSTQPAYFVTWGRYPELAGLVALPSAWAALRRWVVEGSGLIPLVVGGVAVGSSILVHPRTAVLLALLVGAWLAVGLIFEGWRTFLRAFALTLLAGGIGLVLVLPWVVRLWAAHHNQLALPTTAPLAGFPFELMTAGNDRWLVVVAILAEVMALVRRPKLGVLLLIWCALAFVIANPAAFHLPVQVAMNDGSIAIAAFVPVLVLDGFFIDGLLVLVGWKRWSLVARAAVVVATCVGLTTQIEPMLQVANPCCVLANSADVAALRWVGEHTPANARFLIDGYLWQDPAWAGTDAGAWLPALAQRSVSLPPPFYATGPSGMEQATNMLAARVNAAANDPAALAKLARDEGFDYVFVGTRGGPLDPGRLARSPYFTTVFSAGGASVLKVVGVGNASN
jgi:hypothetical protein